jgi:hypothetical protein
MLIIYYFWQFLVILNTIKVKKNNVLKRILTNITVVHKTGYYLLYDQDDIYLFYFFKSIFFYFLNLSKKIDYSFILLIML